MKIGILTYHSAYNFGANLQALSTLCYCKKNGIEAKIINWRPQDLTKHYEKITPPEQAAMHEDFFNKYYDLTDICHTDIEIADMIEKESFDAVIIGSDAVCRNFPFLVRWRPSRTLGVLKNGLYTTDLFPNPFWGCFSTHLQRNIPIILMSVSSQGSPYKYTLQGERRRMSKALSAFSYVSVRDSWTQQLFDYCSYGKLLPEITPDPVFGFNFNTPKELTSQSIIERFNLPRKYIILSFKRMYSPPADWVRKFVECCRKEEIAVVSLPYPQEENHLDVDINLSLPINPIEWYNLIKYSMGYVGNNMHPIVVSIHNEIPFYSFDYYAMYNILTRKVNLKASKIYDLLSKNGILDNYVNVQSHGFQFPHPNLVFERVYHADKDKRHAVANDRLTNYIKLMKSIEQHIAESTAQRNETML